MIGIRTPTKGSSSAQRVLKSPQREEKAINETERAQSSTESDRQVKLVRQSIGEIEAKLTENSPLSQNSSVGKLASQNKLKARAGLQTSKVAGPPEVSPKMVPKYKNKTSEAKACLLKAKLHLSNSRNIKNEIKVEVTQAVERLYILVKELEDGQKDTVNIKEQRLEQTQILSPPSASTSGLCFRDLSKQIDDHSRTLKESREEMAKLTEKMRAQLEICEKRCSYADVTAGYVGRRTAETAVMHSVIITSEDDQETGDQVFEKVRNAINATEEGARIDKIRKAKDRKIILGCRDREELRKVKTRIEEKGVRLNVIDMKNKDPLVVFFDVIQSHTNESIIKAIRAQNKHILADVCGEDDRLEIQFRRKARNPLTAHIVARVSPRIWQRLTDAGAVHIDVQKIRVADQSPLIQCSRCLGYGHGKRFCREAVDVCSNCGGAHLKSECPDWLTNAMPSCVNCQKAKIDRSDHNAFSNECPVRRKWEALARSTVAYC